MSNSSVKCLTFSAILVALGILIPMVMPVKVVIGPASFTLASHVPTFLAMFISPQVAVIVALGTAFGFFLTTPVIIAFRALSHVIFAYLGAVYLQKHPNIVMNRKQFFMFNAVIGVIHAVVELAVVSVFFFAGNMSAATYEHSFLYVVVGLIGVGGFIHSMIDYSIAFYLGKTLSKQFDFPVFTQAKSKEKELSSITF